MSKEKLTMSAKYADEVLERLRVVEHRSLNNEQRSQTNKEDLARVFDAGSNLVQQDTLSDNEKCLVYMYRYLVANEGDEKEMVLRADNRGYLELGFG